MKDVIKEKYEYEKIRKNYSFQEIQSIYKKFTFSKSYLIQIFEEKKKKSCSGLFEN